MAGKCKTSNLVKVTRAYSLLVDFSMSDELERRGRDGSFMHMFKWPNERLIINHDIQGRGIKGQSE